MEKNPNKEKLRPVGQPHESSNNESDEQGVLPRPSPTLNETAAGRTSAEPLLGGEIFNRGNNDTHQQTQHPQRRKKPPGGDFAGDLNPSFAPDQPAGNVMGPNHPMFQGGSGDGFATNPNDDYRSGFGMRPRFDPFGPPGGPQQVSYPQRGSGGGERRRPSGEPNPDHLEPPNSLGNDNEFS